MSIQKKTIPTPATTREVIESITCDLCGKVCPHADTDSDGINWLPHYGDTAKTGVFIGKGYSYDDCASIEFRDYHICPECFEKKLEPWLKEQRAVFTTREISW